MRGARLRATGTYIDVREDCEQPSNKAVRPRSSLSPRLTMGAATVVAYCRAGFEGEVGADLRRIAGRCDASLEIDATAAAAYVIARATGFDAERWSNAEGATPPIFARSVFIGAGPIALLRIPKRGHAPTASHHCWRQSRNCRMRRHHGATCGSNFPTPTTARHFLHWHAHLRRASRVSCRSTSRQSSGCTCSCRMAPRLTLGRATPVWGLRGRWAFRGCACHATRRRVRR